MKRKRNIIIIGLMLLLLATVPVQRTLAYFTDIASYSGGGSLSLQWDTEIKEEIKDNNKHIQIKNTGDTDVIVRVSVFGNADYLTVKNLEESGKWIKKDDGWWYYSGILAPEETTDVLLAELKASADLPSYEFEIIVVHESERVVYDGGALVKPEGWTYVPEVSNE